MSTQIFEKIYYAYCDAVYRVAYNYMKNTQDAEDITQDVFAKLYILEQDFENEEHIKRWLIRVTINRCKDKLRSAWFRKTVAMKNDFLLELPDCSDVEKKSDIRDIIDQLSNKYSVPLYLYYFEGYQIKEIASFLRCTESVIKMRLKKGRDLLKLELEPILRKEK